MRPFLFVHLQIKEGLVVGAPLNGTVAFELGVVIHDLSGGNVLDEQLRHLVPGEIHGVGDEFAVSFGVGRRGLDRSRRAVLLPLRELVDVQIRDLPGKDGRVGRTVPRFGSRDPVLVFGKRRSAVRAIRFARERSRVVKVPVLSGGRNRMVGFLDTGHHLVVEVSPQITEVGSELFRVRVFLLQVFQDLFVGSALVAHPSVRIADLHGWIEEGFRRAHGLPDQRFRFLFVGPVPGILWT
mmetsp:Transcript_5351/g.13437  ORF Transcript_5351/g.13437 Transcript_5351/m.13437 type:complete len:239 (-) Transcript_5351:403-1119(-)